MTREPAVEERGEGVAAHRRGLRDPDEQQVRRAARVASQSEREPEPPKRTDYGTIRVALDRTRGDRLRSRCERRRGMAHIRRLAHKIRLTSLPHLASRT